MAQKFVGRGWSITFDGDTSTFLYEPDRHPEKALTFALGDVISARKFMGTIQLKVRGHRLVALAFDPDKRAVLPLVLELLDPSQSHEATQKPNPRKRARELSAEAATYPAPTPTELMAYIKAEKASTGVRPSISEARIALGQAEAQRFGRFLARFGPVKLYEDWIDAGGGNAGPVEGASATVDASGAFYARKTFTRAVLLGPLATQAKKDGRELFLLIETPQFVKSFAVDPKMSGAARTFAAMVSTQGRRSGATEAPEADPAMPALPTPADRLFQLKQLLDAGVITEEDFDAKKSELLGQL